MERRKRRKVREKVKEKVKKAKEKMAKEKARGKARPRWSFCVNVSRGTAETVPEWPFQRNAVFVLSKCCTQPGKGKSKGKASSLMSRC